MIFTSIRLPIRYTALRPTVRGLPAFLWWVPKALKVLRVLLEQQVLRELQVQLVHKVLLVRRVQRDFKVQQVQRVPKVLRVQREQQEQQVLQEQLVLKDRLGS